MRHTLLYSLLAFLLFLAPTRAQAETAFFDAIQDMPLMEGLIELPDQTIMFDKPQGRIIETTALIEKGTQDEVIAYYNATLPQLGWTKTTPLAFTRDGEHLQFRFQTLKEEKFFSLIVTPR